MFTCLCFLMHVFLLYSFNKSLICSIITFLQSFIPFNQQPTECFKFLQSINQHTIREKIHETNLQNDESFFPFSSTNHSLTTKLLLLPMAKTSKALCEANDLIFHMTSFVKFGCEMNTSYV